MKEKDIEAKVVRWARANGFLVYKFVSPGRPSVPDRMFIAPGGCVLFIEFKQSGKTPTARQRQEIARLEHQGCQVATMDDAEKAIKWLKFQRLVG